MRFTSIVAGWPGSAHDTRIFRDTLDKYKKGFPHPPAGKYYLVDPGYPNDTGYLAPYRGQKYHLPEFRMGRPPSGKEELFNFAHSSLRNVIERSFGVLKQKWRILLDIPSYRVKKQTKIIIACMALHNFIRESEIFDEDFDKCDRDENYMPPGHVVVTNGWNHEGQGNVNMNASRQAIANGLMADRE
ncbi:protein ALP1-like [Brachypodium distachyon]|uniref:protein ALP1-like n=1 Tax=Brachypodium distachyon TaxID=15368 RepID=UPI000D0DC123|nr:protein ALP1-like [Brachypodium distachyon]|eukprot:XP_024310351.1 protein ALP1-like [Brachypodium distachyon]